MTHVRRAGPLDAAPMAGLLNRIIIKGGTTANTTPVTTATIQGWMSHHSGSSAWHIAEDDRGSLLGFQFIEPHVQLPPEACDVATYVAIGRTGIGIGSRLFDATRAAACSLGYRWINATIRTDNSGGLAYYQSRGFENYTRDHAVRLDDGTVIDKISKRFDL